MIRWLAALLILLWPGALLADELRPASIDFTQVSDSEWTLSWKQPVVQRTPPPLVVPAVPANCRIEGEPVRRIAQMALLGSADVRCEGNVAGGSIGFPALLGNADALARVAPLDRPVQSLRLTASEPSAVISPKPDPWQVWRSYFVYGVEHILAGWDHLLFVIALVLLVVKPWPVVKAATAFTVAHSITLVGTTLGFVGLPQRPVEALIALSIVFLAVELARDEKAGEGLTKRWPWMVAFLFGLLHGFGFAGALRELGLPEGEVPAALVSFNLGVEAGQLLVIAAVLALRAVVTRIKPAAIAPALRVATYGIGIIGSYWLVDRVVG